MKLVLQKMKAPFFGISSPCVSESDIKSCLESLTEVMALDDWNRWTTWTDEGDHAS